MKILLVVVILLITLLITNCWVGIAYKNYSTRMRIKKAAINTQTMHFEGTAKNMHARKVYGHLEMLIEYYEAFGLKELYVEKLILEESQFIIEYKILGNKEKVEFATQFLKETARTKDAYFVNKEIIKAKNNFWNFMSGNYEKLKD